MRRILLVMLIAAGCARADGTNFGPTYPTLIAEALRLSLPTGWTCKADSGALVITRNEPVILLNTISQIGRDAGVTLDQYLQQNGQKSDYTIVLVFRPRLTVAELATLRGLRDAAIKKTKDDSSLGGKTKASKLMEERERHPIPDYFNSQFDIYLHRTDPPHVAVFPVSAADERDKIMQILSEWITKHGDHNE